MTKREQYYEYLAWGGTFTFEQWEQDGRYDPGADNDKQDDEQDAYNPYLLSDDELDRAEATRKAGRQF